LCTSEGYLGACMELISEHADKYAGAATGRLNVWGTNLGDCRFDSK
jgi:hypothetical protein